jgi:E3 ubiquitin-protein ligase SHPRH
MSMMDEQTDLLLEWRQHVSMLLTTSFANGANENADGEEYNRSLDTQGEVEQYMQAYSALLADRKEAMLAERTVLAIHDVKGIRKRKTKAAAKAVAAIEALQGFIPEEIAPEDQVLKAELAQKRENIKTENGTKATCPALKVERHVLPHSIVLIFCSRQLLVLIR